MDILSYALSKKFTEDTAIGLGAVKGAPCTISSIQDNGDSTTLTFRWTGTDGTVQSSTMTVKNGISVTSVDLDETTNKLTCTLSDGSIQECGIVNVVTDVSKIEYTPSVDATIHTVEDALNKLITKTDAELESPLVSNVAIGSIVSGTTFPKGTSLEEIIRQMLTQYIKPVVNLVINPNQTLYDEVEDSLTSITLNAVVTKKTSDIAKVEFYVNNTLVSTITANVTNGGTFPYIYTPATPITDDTSFRVVVTDVEDGEGTMSKAITFIGNSYYGIVEPTTSTVSEATIKTLNKNLKNTNDFVYSNISCEYNKIVYCYPSELGKLSTIADEKNSFNYMESFECQNVTVDGIPYYAYVLIEPTGVDSAEITFK